MIDIANKYANYNPEYIIDFIKMGFSKNFIKLITFCKVNNVNNDIIDQVMAIKPARLEDETRDDYKNRQRFQKYLLKYRYYVYNYDNFTRKQFNR